MVGCRRAVLVGLGAAAGGLLGAACGVGGGGGQPPGAGQVTQPVTLRFTNVWEGARKPLMEAQIADFKALQPQITIENEIVSQAQMYDKYLAEIAAGNPAAVIMMAAAELPRFGKAAALQPLDAPIKRDKLSPPEAFYESEARLSQWQGSYLGLPQTVGAGNAFAFYNKGHYAEAGLPDKAPATWTETLDRARTLTKRAGDTFDRLGARLPLQAFKQLVVVNGGALFDRDGKKVAFNSAEGLQALQWQLDAAEGLYGGQASLAALNAELARGTPGQELRKLSQQFEGVWRFYEVSQNAPDVQLGAGPFPSNKDKNPRSKETALADGAFCWLYSVPTGAKEVEAGWRWLRYLTEGEGNKAFFFAQGRPSPVRRHTEGQDYQKVNPHWQVVVQALKTATLVPPPPGYGRVQAVWTAMTNDVMTRKAAPKEALDAAARDVQQILDEEWGR